MYAQAGMTEENELEQSEYIERAKNLLNLSRSDGQIQNINPSASSKSI